MKTFLPKTSDIVRKWHLVDASGKTLGRIATEIAILLRGKSKPEFTHHLDVGDAVVVVNAEKISLTGDKWAQKKYYSHSGYIGSIKEVTAQKLIEKKPTELLRKAVFGMIPKNRLKKDILMRLRIFTGPKHDLEAQKPEPVSF